MKKILILAMSCQNEFFVEQEKYVKETWAKDIIDGKYPNISFMIYRGGYEKNSYSKQDYLLKLNVEDDINSTFKKTYFALSMIYKKFGDYDYVFRTNTSTFVNVELLNAFIEKIENDEILYSGEIYSLSELCTPYPMCLIGRGNSMILSKKIVNILLQNGISFLYQNNATDDNIIGNILNSYHIKKGEDYKDYIKSFYHGWYKCVSVEVNNNHKLCKYCEKSQDYDFWKNFITIQIRNYGDLTSFECRKGESEKYYEIQKIFENKKNDNIETSLKLNFDRSNNYDIFIGSILGYISLDTWKQMDKYKLYNLQVNHKASDDLPGQSVKDKPFIYIDYHNNENKNILI